MAHRYWIYRLSDREVVGGPFESARGVEYAVHALNEEVTDEIYVGTGPGGIKSCELCGDLATHTNVPLDVNGRLYRVEMCESCLFTEEDTIDEYIEDMKERLSDDIAAVSTLNNYLEGRTEVEHYEHYGHPDYEQ